MSKANDLTKAISQAKGENSAPRLHKSNGKPPKRSCNEMSPNTSVEEITLIHTTLDGLSEDFKGVRESLKTLMTKDDIETFVKNAVKEILDDFNKNMEFTINSKVEEKTKTLSTQLDKLEKENEQLRKDMISQKSMLADVKKNYIKCDERSKSAEQKANYNEQYSRKNNIKFMNVPEVPDENEEKLTTTICELVGSHGVTVDESKILAIHRIPGKAGHQKPILVKLTNNNEKSKIMRLRPHFKASGSRLVDDVTKTNAQLIDRLWKHDQIESAWYFNGAVYGKTTSGTRHKFDVHDDISTVIE